MSEAPDGMYIVKDCVTYRVEPRVEKMFPLAKKHNLVTGEVIYSTNADRIRAMTDEELAAKIEELCQYTFMQISVYSKPFGKAEWLDWLKQEVTEHSTT